MTTYERITYRQGRGHRTVILEDPAEITIKGVPVVTGGEVDREGVAVEPGAAFLREHQAVTGAVRYMIEREQITKRQPMVMNFRYGELEVA